ncbi:lysophospholipid acyltransferase family protein [Polymorphum gilvum]|uniref:Bacterial lipid A biosynthesis acyltransferase superfamily n=1 Tax=Polymorphum gilvum (strain LMG 25793 / CGMCC 1.9160 / SL003B-26A1) TaxID=991905 RepID=F2IZT9_POLGS|nr:lysophospholipid acyltransferase family protein [Polymorphum gilvum]ADZ70665.1 Bacterial lipid A biosynthesis acyltransferase superfamily [Polymorphum gilvum SL003B-26A1]
MPPRSLLAAVRHRIEWLALIAVVTLFRLIPVDAASAAMGFLWRSLAPFNKRHKRALKHLKVAFPEKSDVECEAIARGMWSNLGRVAAETFHIDRLLVQDARFEAVPDPETERILASGSGCIFVSLHTGNWELCVQPAVRQGLAIAGVYQALTNPRSDALLRSMRRDLYKAGLYSKGHQTARKLIAILRQGGIVALMGDLREVRGIQVPFFGRPAYATPVPASLARSVGVPIIVGRVVRTRGVRFRVEGRCLHVPVTDDRQDDIVQATAAIHALFEEWIREHPDQWMWIHRKWATG